jgi:hypothetical protein
MTHRARKRIDALERCRNFVAGTLIGSGVVTPVFAATDIMRSDWTTLLMVASIVLLGIGVLLRIRARDHTPGTQPHDSEDSIGRFRPQIDRS